MKIAQLHNGIKISFPDGTTDKVIKKTVKSFVQEVPIANAQDAMKQPSLLMDIYVDLSHRIGKVKEWIDAIPQPVIPEQIMPPEVKLGRLEELSASIDKRLSAPPDELQAIEGILLLIKKELASDKISPYALRMQELLNGLTNSVSALELSIKRSNTELRDTIMKASRDQTAAFVKAIDKLTATVDTRIEEAAASFKATLQAPREIIYDKEKRPIGMKIKR